MKNNSSRKQLVISAEIFECMTYDPDFKDYLAITRTKNPASKFRETILCHIG